jgi:hypothetical protein
LKSRGARRLGWLVAGVLLVQTTGNARADSYIPAYPYNYLHPPSGTHQNHKPTSGTLTLHLKHNRTPVELVLFTKDGQAGIDVPRGAISAQGAARTVTASITPVNLPRAIPAPRLLDGNAYRFSLAATPNRFHTQLHRRFNLILRWPHSPNAVLQFSKGHWRTLCTYGGWTLGISTVACATSSFGTYAVVRLAIKARG